MRILLTGGQGQLAFELTRSLALLGSLTVLDRAGLDLVDEAAVRSSMRRWRPDVIVNAAAYTAVDRAESEPELAQAVNARGPALLAEEAAATGALIIHYSTDYVFDGNKPDLYLESDAPNPLGVYGSSKWQGERAVAAATPRHLILRTSWVFGAHGANFLKTMLRLALERTELKVVADQHGTPTSSALLADATAHLVRRYQTEDQRQERFPFGTYHLVASGETTWYDYARLIVSEAEKLGRPLRAGPEAIRPITTPEYPTPARRPANSRLSNARFVDTFGLTLPPWQDGVRHVVKQLR